jgi:hypothetical protein
MQPFPYLVIAPMSREILANAHHLTDEELIRIAGSLRALADEVMVIVERRFGGAHVPRSIAGRPAPRLVVDNTQRDARSPLADGRH